MRWHFVDRVKDTDEENWIIAEKTFPKEAEWHQDHFPGNPIVPGVLHIEAAANTLGELILMRELRETGTPCAPLLLKTFDCTFKEILRPGELFEIEMKIDKWTRKIVRGSGELKRDGQLISKISIASARTVVTNAGDPSILIPWRMKHMKELHPNYSKTLGVAIEKCSEFFKK